MPGSLGLEAMMQMLELYALRHNIGDKMKNPVFNNRVGKTVWKYRGQLLQKNKRMDIDMHIKDIIERDDEIIITCEASLFVDKLRVYHVMDLGISITDDAEGKE